MTGYDIDGTLTNGANIKIIPEGSFVVISGRLFEDYDNFCKELAQKAPVYIRGIGAKYDWEDVAKFKAMMITHLCLTEFHEDDQLMVNYIKDKCPNCNVIKVTL